LGTACDTGRGEGIDQLCSRLIADARKLRLMAFVLTDPDRSLLLVPDSRCTYAAVSELDE
jgi:hypothetical protein